MTSKTFDVAEFLEFCRSKPTGERYPVTVTSKCALAQFGFPGVGMFTRENFGISDEVYRAVVFNGHYDEKPEDFNTFSALATRLAALSGEG